MSVRSLAVTALLALSLAAAPAAAVATTLFAHFGAPEEPFGLGTQEPDAAFLLDAGKGAEAMTLSCAPDTPAGAAGGEAHTLHAFVLGDAVAYAGGEATLPPLKGMRGDLALVGPPTLHWYWSAETAGVAGTSVVAPEVVVRATLFDADAVDLAAATFEEGQAIAAGESEPALLAGPASQGVEHEAVGDRTVYHFVVPMDAEPGARLSRVLLPMLRVETFVKNAACADGHVMPGAVRLHSSPGHRPRLELDTAEPLSMALPLHAELREPTGDPPLSVLLLHAKVDDAWGLYDIGRLEATVEGPGLPLTAMERAAELQPSQRLYDEGVATFALLGDSAFEAGDYTFRVSASTLQGANGSWQESIHLGEEPEAPALGPALALLAVVAAAAALRRRA